MMKKTQLKPHFFVALERKIQVALSKFDPDLKVWNESSLFVAQNEENLPTIVQKTNLKDKNYPYPFAKKGVLNGVVSDFKETCKTEKFGYNNEKINFGARTIKLGNNMVTQDNTGNIIPSLYRYLQENYGLDLTDDLVSGAYLAELETQIRKDEENGTRMPIVDREF